MDVRETPIMGTPCVVMRSGYTGEDGFEISMPPDVAREIVEGLLEDPDVTPAGLAARDTLRLEAGLCLYGADLDGATTPVMAGLSWAIPKSRRGGGERLGGFPGSPSFLTSSRGVPGLVVSAWRPRAGCQFAQVRHFCRRCRRRILVGHVTSGGRPKSGSTNRHGLCPDPPFRPRHPTFRRSPRQAAAGHCHSPSLR